MRTGAQRKLANEKLVFIVPNHSRPFREFKTVFIFSIIIDACSAIQEKFFVSQTSFCPVKMFHHLIESGGTPKFGRTETFVTAFAARNATARRRFRTCRPRAFARRRQG